MSNTKFRDLWSVANPLWS